MAAGLLIFELVILELIMTLVRKVYRDREFQVRSIKFSPSAECSIRRKLHLV